MPYDLQAARQSGASDDQILGYLAGNQKYDIDGALKAGASKQQLLEYLAGKDGEVALPPGVPAGSVKKTWGGQEHWVPGPTSEVLGPGDAAVLPLGAGMATNAIKTGLGVAGGYLGGKAGEAVADYFGASPKVKQAAGIAGSIPGAMAGAGLSNLVSKGAPTVARSALGLPDNDSAKALLDETSGLRPKTILEQARAKIKELAQQRDAAVLAAKTQPSLRPAIDSLNSTAAKMAAGNSETAALDPMLEQLTVPRPGFAGASGPQPPAPPPGYQGPAGPVKISELQDPENFLAMRQRFGKDFTKFEHAKPTTSETRRAANNAYMKMTDELHRVAPEAGPLDERMSNLIPVENRAKVVANQPGAAARMIDRSTRATGGMAVPIAGAALGGKAGALAASTAQETLSAPAVRVGLARILNSAGKPLPFAGVPAATAVSARGSDDPLGLFQDQQ